MDWQDVGFVLSASRFGDTDAVLEVLTENHGRHMGLVKGGLSKTRRAMLQPGNQVSVAWQARLSEHLGRFDVEPLRAYASLALDSGRALAGIAAAAALGSAVLPERESHPAAAEGLAVLIQALTGGNGTIAPAIFVKWELGLLQELGFGLDLSVCAVSGAREGLALVSPRTGRAVTRDAAGTYAGRLLPLPGFLIEGTGVTPSPHDIADGFRLTRHFLLQSVLEPHGKTMPPARDRYVDMVTREPLSPG